MHISSICDLSPCRMFVPQAVRLDGQIIRAFRLSDSIARGHF